ESLKEWSPAVRLAGRPIERQNDRTPGPVTGRRYRGASVMFITKAKLSRRTVLRGMGATLSLPLLEAMVPALTPVVKTAANPIKRFGAVFVPLGERPGYWTPKTVGPDFEFSPILKPLERFRNSMTVISELCDPLDGHATTVAAWLSGAIPFR